MRQLSCFLYHNVPTLSGRYDFAPRQAHNKDKDTMANNLPTRKQGEAAMNREARRKAREKRAGEQLSLAGSALIGSAAFSFLTTKMPRLKSVDNPDTGSAKIHTAPVLAILGIFGGMGSRSNTMLGAGIGIGSAWISDYVSDQTWAQPTP